ncbi:terminase small subunit [Rhizobium mayense]|uniref:Terminase small subunit n=1 Tax=Rhizobium mayense TaxID=1312184 RepID=A0ABT7K0B2_9HYPH|nr:terminase small subunit [Rhizobium mayense]MDL2401582.1 terminase small subunit [Rhizobium mayense]
MSKIDDIETSNSAIDAVADLEERLTHREIRFVREYLIDLDPKRAAIEAGYSKTVAASKAYQWVSNGKVKPLAPR